MVTAQKPNPVVGRKAPTSGTKPATPEATAGVVKKRKRLAKVFKRPLDKTLRGSPLVREKYSIPAPEYEALLGLKNRLSELGLPVKKSELLRAGLQQLSTLADDALKEALLRIQSLG